MSHKDAVHNDPFVCLIRRLNPDKKVVMRRPASLLSVEKNGGRGKRRARSECEFYFFSKAFMSSISISPIDLLNLFIIILMRAVNVSSISISSLNLINMFFIIIESI